MYKCYFKKMLLKIQIFNLKSSLNEKNSEAIEDDIIRSYSNGELKDFHFSVFLFSFHACIENRQNFKIYKSLACTNHLRFSTV